MKKLLGTVKVGGYSVKVYLRDPVDIMGHLGEFHSDTYSVHVSTAVSQSTRRVVLAHEVFHAFLFVSGLGHQLDLINTEFEESLTLSFEHTIAHLMTFSPKLEAWIDAD